MIELRAAELALVIKPLATVIAVSVTAAVIHNALLGGQEKARQVTLPSTILKNSRNLPEAENSLRRKRPATGASGSIITDSR